MSERARRFVLRALSDTYSALLLLCARGEAPVAGVWSPKVRSPQGSRSALGLRRLRLLDPSHPAWRNRSVNALAACPGRSGARRAPYKAPISGSLHLFLLECPDVLDVVLLEPRQERPASSAQLHLGGVRRVERRHQVEHALRRAISRPRRGASQYSSSLSAGMPCAPLGAVMK